GRRPGGGPNKAAGGPAPRRGPVAGPLEPGGVGDRDEAEVALGEPLPEEAQRLVVRLGRALAEDELEPVAQLVGEGGHALIVRGGPRAWPRARPSARAGRRPACSASSP